MTFITYKNDSKGKQIEISLSILIFKFSYASLGWKKFSIRFSIEWGWDYKQY